MSAPATLSSGASRWSNASLSINKAAISAPTPCYGHPSSTFTILFVFFTESITACLSRGLIDLRLITSALIPWSAYKISAALSEWPVTGLYLLTFRFHLQNIASNHNDNQFKIVTSNRTHTVLGEITSSSIGFSGSMNQTSSLIVDMDANDTASLTVDFRGGSKTVDVHNDGFFMGYLLG